MFDLTKSRVLLCMLGARSLYRAPLVSPHEVFVGPHCGTHLEGSVKTLAHAPGDVDLADILHRLRPDWEPDVVVVKADATGANFVRNLDAFEGPRLLMVGDTHHLAQPLRKIIRYARSEPFDAFLVTHTPHHSPFFRKAGLNPLWSFPGIEANHYPQPRQEHGLPVVAFVGSMSAHHPYRARVISAMERAGLPLKVERLEPQEAAKRYAESAISLNVSLNGDLNLRVWEVLSAGGLLLTDHLASETGIGEWFEAGKHYVTYDTPDEAISRARHLLAHPDEARGIRAAGHERYMELHDPDTLWRAVGERLSQLERRARPISLETLPNGFLSELSQYEWLQEKHRVYTRVEIEPLGEPMPETFLPRIVTAEANTAVGWGLSDVSAARTFRLLWTGGSSSLTADVLGRFSGSAIRVPPGETWQDCAEWGFAPNMESAGIYSFESPIQQLKTLISRGQAEAARAKTRSIFGAWPNPEMCLEAAHLWASVGASSVVGEVLESGLRAYREDARFWNTWVQWLASSGAPETSVFRAEASRWGMGPGASEDDFEKDPMLEGWSVRTGRSRVAKTTTPRRILLLTNLFPPQELGGYGRMMWEFVAGLVARGHAVKVLCADVPAFTRPAEAIEVEMVPDVQRVLKLFGHWEHGKAVSLKDPEAVKAVVLHNLAILEQTLDAWNPDVGILGNLDYIGHPVLSQWLERGQSVIHCVANKGPGYPVEVTPTTERFQVAPCSDWNGKAMQSAGYPINHYSVVYPGARTERFFQLVPPTFDRLRICYASLVMPYKGAHVLVNALMLLHRWGIPFECEIAGDSTNPDFVQELKRLSEQSGFSKQLKFSGFLDREGLARLFMRSNTLVFPSVFEEPFGISQVEAMAAGLVVLSSGTGGASEIVEDGLNGLKFESQNALDLARKLADLAEDPERAQMLSQKAQERAEVFNVKHSVERLERMIEDLLDATKGNAPTV